jgi:opacity protein-like surface antigen
VPSEGVISSVTMRQFLLLAVLAAPAAALEPGREALSLYGGLAAPFGAVGDRSKLGFSGGASYRHQFTQRMSGAFEGEYMKFGDEDVAGATSGADALSIGLHLRMDAAKEGSHAPFITIGAAMNRVARRIRTGAIDESTTDWAPGVTAGLGALIYVNERAAFGPSARFRHLGKHGWAVSGGLELSFALAGAGG